MYVDCFGHDFFFTNCTVAIVYKYELYELQHSMELQHLQRFSTHNGQIGGNATLYNNFNPLPVSRFPIYPIGTDHVFASANSKNGPIYSNNDMFTSILEELDEEYILYIHNKIKNFESEIRQNGLWKVVLEMVPEHNQCVVYLQQLWDSVRLERGVDTIPVALATLIYYIVRVTLKRMRMLKANQTEQREEFEIFRDELIRDRTRNFHVVESIDHVIKELNELSMMIGTTISEISNEVPLAAQCAFSEIAISADVLENKHDSVWSRMQDAPTQSTWYDFKDSIGIKKVKKVVGDMTAQAIKQSLHKVHEFQYIYDLSKSQKTEFLKEYGLLYSSETPTESPVTCQTMFADHPATFKNPSSHYAPLRYTNHQPLCNVTRGKPLLI